MVTIEVTIRLLHSPNSTGPAFLVELRQQLTSSFMLLSYNHSTTGGLTAMSGSDLSSSLLLFNMDTFQIGEVLTIVYKAHVDPESEGNIANDVIVSYATIKQEGIGLQVRYKVYQ